MPGDHLGLANARGRGFFPEDVRRAVVHGNPDRVIQQARLLDQPRLVARKRGFTTYTGKYEGVSVLISSTGMGSGSASIAMEELIQLGINLMIRVGTCGAYLKDAKPGDLFVPTSALVDGPALRYLSPDYLHNWPPRDLPKWVSTRKGFVFVEGHREVSTLITRLVNEELRSGRCQYSHTCFEGAVHDKDILHAWRTEYSLKPSELERVREQIRGLTVATDMETGTLFTISRMRKTVSGSLLTAVDFSADQESEAAQNEALKIAYKTSLEVLARFVG